MEVIKVYFFFKKENRVFIFVIMVLGFIRIFNNFMDDIYYFFLLCFVGMFLNMIFKGKEGCMLCFLGYC